MRAAHPRAGKAEFMNFAKPSGWVAFFQHVACRRHTHIFIFCGVGDDGFDAVGIILTGQQAIYRDIMLCHLPRQPAAKSGERRARAV